MSKYNLICSNTGRVKKDVDAESLDKATDKFCDMGYDMDDNFVQLASETQAEENLISDRARVRYAYGQEGWDY